MKQSEISNFDYDLFDILKLKNKRKFFEIYNVENLNCCSEAIAYTSKFHSYFHFEQSYGYSLIALCLYEIAGRRKTKEVEEHLKLALFQDHGNEIAKEVLKFDFLNHPNLRLLQVLSYQNHITYEKDFYSFASLDISCPNLDRDLEALDSFIESSFNKAVEDDSEILVDSHRLNFSKAINLINRKDYQQALVELKLAISDLEKRHSDYHKFLQNLYNIRSDLFAKNDKHELAKYDLVKAREFGT